MDYTKYFEPLELAREAGKIDDALFKSQQALLDAGSLSDPVLAVNALGHQLLIFKDQFTRTGNEFYLHLMHSFAKAGMQLAKDLEIVGQPVAVMHLRSGDYFFHYKKYLLAVEEMVLALENLGDIKKEKPGEYAEYLSHLGKAKVFAGQTEDGLRDLKSAVELTGLETELRDFHHKVIHSANLARLAFAYLHLGNKDEAAELAKEIAPIALELKDKYNMPMRLEELEKIAKQSGVQIQAEKI